MRPYPIACHWTYQDKRVVGGLKEIGVFSKKGVIDYLYFSWISNNSVACYLTGWEDIALSLFRSHHSNLANRISMQTNSLQKHTISCTHSITAKASWCPRPTSNQFQLLTEYFAQNVIMIACIFLGIFFFRLCIHSCRSSYCKYIFMAWHFNWKLVCHFWSSRSPSCFFDLAHFCHK